MNEKKKEIRSILCELSIREAPQDAQGESRTVEGTAIVFDSESELLDDWGYRFKEIIKPSACTMEFLNTQDIKMNLLHDRSLTVARWNKGVGNLRLWVDERGLNFSFEALKCDLGERLLEMVRSGVYSGCSFEFYPQDYELEEVDDTTIIRHTAFRALTALTIGMDPAYTQTSVNARELSGKPTEEPKTEKPNDEEDMEREKAEAMDGEMHRRADNLKRLSSNIF